MNDSERRVDLPLPVTGFIGRRAELTRLETLFNSGARLVTLWGPGGIGKTRLALQFAANYSRRLKGASRAYLCDVEDTQDLLGVCVAMGRALDVPLPSGEHGAEEIADRIAHVVRGRGASLFILDNFEQVAEHAPGTLVRWMKSAPDVRFLVTSRERLRVAGEVVEELGPLSLATGNGSGGRSEAVELFIDRARALGFEPDEETVGLAEELVGELEGIPLAIELAAGRIDTLGIEGMLEPMRRIRSPSNDSEPPSTHPRLDVLAGGRRDMVKRQVTVRATIAWSWDLLTHDEQRALAQCAVFRGGFTPAAAMRVLDPGDEAPPTLDVIQSLRNKSLLRSYQTSRGEVRLSLYESVREFAAEKLGELGETAAIEARHQEFFLDVATRLADRGVNGLRLLTAELDNLMSIANRTLKGPNPSSGDATLALRALVAAGPVYAVRGPIALYLAWLDKALKAADGAGGVPTATRARALQARGRAQPQRGRAADGLLDLAAALEAARGTGERSMEGTILADMGVLHHHLRDMEKARKSYEQALAIHRGLGERRAVGRALGNLGALNHDLKSFEEALGHYQRALGIFRETADKRAEGLFLTNIGLLHQEQGDSIDAEKHFTQALELLAEVGDRRLEAITLGSLGALQHESGRLEPARAAHQEALVRIREFGDRRSEGLCLTRLGAVLAEEGRVHEATERFAAAEELLAQAADPIALEVVSVSRGFLDVANALLCRSAGDEEEMAAHVRQARSRVARARAGGIDKPAPAEVNDDIRVAIRILERSLDAVDTGASEALAPPEDVFLVGPEAQWIRPPAGSWQDFRRRRALRLLVLALVDQRERNRPPLALDALRQAGWPGEVINHDAAVNRIHVALAELRKRGLKPVLKRKDQGYLLDPGVEVRRVPGAMCPS